MLQRLLFGDDAEALAQELEREKARAYTEARKLAWSQGKPFAEDVEKYYAAHRDEINARCRERYRITYPATAELHLLNGARLRAERLGCNVGRAGPLLRIYTKAVHSNVLLCYWCKKLTLPGERHVDHKTPLATGGAHVAGNLCIACADCNLSKGDINPADFRKLVAERRAANSVVAADYFRGASSLVSGRAGSDSERLAFGVLQSSVG